MARALTPTGTRWRGVTAIYDSAVHDLTSLLSDLETGAEGASTRIRIRAAPPGMRCDLLSGRRNRADFSVIRFGESDPHLLDNARKRYRTLPLAAHLPRADAWRLERTGAQREFAFGPASEVLVLLRGPREADRPALSLWLLESPPEPINFAIWWDLLLPGLDRPRGSLGLPVEIRLIRNRYDAPAAEMRLTSIKRDDLPASTFLPPDDFAPEPADQLDRRKLKLTRPPDGGPGRNGTDPGTGANSSLSILFAAGANELAKLLINGSVIERIRTAANSAVGNLNPFEGDNLVTPTQPLKSFTDPVTQAIFYRGLLLHLLLQVQEIASSERSSAEFRKIIEADTDVQRGAVAAPSGADEDEITRFDRVRQIYVDRPAIRIAVNEMFETDSSSNRNIVLILNVLSSLNSELITVARRWLDILVPEFRIEPDPPRTQRNGRTKGWSGGTFISEGLGPHEDLPLIDIKVDVGTHSITFGPSILGPTALVTPGHPFFLGLAALDALAPGSPPSMLRTGISTRLRLSEFSIGALLTTTPATNSLAIVALLIADPSAVAKLWNVADVFVRLSDVTADVIFYSEQDRLGLQPPRLKVQVFGAQAGPQSFIDFTIGHFSLGPSTLLSALNSELDSAFIQGILDAIAKKAAQALTRALESLGEMIRLQPLLTLDHEAFREAAQARIRMARQAHREAETARSAAWQAHQEEAGRAEVGLEGNPGFGGYNPIAEPKPLLDRNGMPLTMEEIDGMQRTFLALSGARVRFTEAERELAAAETALSEFRNNRPPGATVVSGRAEPGGYSLGLSICEPAAPGSGSTLNYPVDPASPLAADLCLVLSARTVIDMFQNIRTGIGYRGPPRNISGTGIALIESPEVDWWQDVPEPERLGARPADIRDGPPEITLDQSALSAGDWRGSWNVLKVGARNVRLRRVNRPTPAEAIGEMVIVVTTEFGVATYTPAEYEYCEDITKLIAAFAEGRLDGPNLPLERPPAGPDGPRPRPDLRPRIGVEAGLRRLDDPGAGAAGQLITMKDLESARVRLSFPNDEEGQQPPRILFSPGPGGGLGPTTRGGDFLCRRIIGWDVKDREIWLRAKREVRIPVYFGIGDRIQLTSNSRSTFRFLPLLTYRFDIGEGSAIGALEIEAAGPLAGMDTRANRLWLEQLLIAHAFTLLNGPTARYRRTRENGLSYAYGPPFTSVLSPENFLPRLLFAMHPDHWSGGNLILDDPAVPFLALETFGTNPDLLNLAVNFFLDENILTRI